MEYQCPTCGATLDNVDPAGPIVRGICPQHGMVKVKKKFSA